MPGVNALRRIQISQMALNSTTDIATTYWRGTGVLDDTREVMFPDENVGIIGGVNRSYTPITGGEITLEQVATYEQLPYIFDSGIHTAAPTTDSGSGYIRTYNLQFSDTDPISSSDLSYLVVEAGDNQQAEIMRSGFVREFTLSGKAGEGMTVAGVVQGQGVATTTFTSGLSIPSVDSVLFSKGTLYIDPSSDAAGTTQKSKTLLSMELNMTTGWQAIMVGDGNTYFSDVKRVLDEGTLQITFEHDASSVTEIGHWRSENERVIRLNFPGTALTSGGAFTTRMLRLTLYGKWETFEPLDESDGNDIVTGTFRIGYSTTAASKGAIVVVNEVSALP